MNFENDYREPPLPPPCEVIQEKELKWAREHPAFLGRRVLHNTITLAVTTAVLTLTALVAIGMIGDHLASAEHMAGSACGCKIASIVMIALLIAIVPVIFFFRSASALKAAWPRWRKRRRWTAKIIRACEAWNGKVERFNADLARAPKLSRRLRADLAERHARLKESREAIAEQYGI